MNQDNTLENLASAEDQDFWNTVEGYSQTTRTELGKLYERTFHAPPRSKDVVRGKVVAMDKREVVVNIGTKSDGVVSLSEFKDYPNLKVGDEVEVYLEAIENRSGEMVLSRKLANSIKTWEKINKALEEDVIMEGIVKRRTKGGFVVDLEGIEAFLPGSQVDVKPIRDYESFVGRRMEFKIVKINSTHDNVVISHKVLIEKGLEAQKLEILNKLEKGQVLEGTVKNMTNFGVFIDLGGLDGLLHITDISWGRITSPEEVLKLHDKINVVVLDFDDDKKRISLGLKQLYPHPWDTLDATLTAGSRITGKVVTIADYGIFIEIIPGVEGLVHVSEMSWSQHPKNPTEIYKISQDVEAVILTLDREERKMSLGIKQLTQDPWLTAAAKYPVNSVHKGIVRNLTNYGLFVELEEGVDGLIHVSDLSWSKKFNHPSEYVKKDEELDVIVLEIDIENHKLSLGHKQLTEDPWATFESIFSMDSVHQGLITKITDKGAMLEMEYGVEGFTPTKHLATAPGEPALKVGDTIDFKVIEFSKDAKKIVFSHTKYWKDLQGQLEDKAKKTRTSSPKEKVSKKLADAERSTLGEIDALAALKANLMAQERDAAKEKLEKAAEKNTNRPTEENPES